jgi:glycosyltransferase involved in cell wall biosynthesis
VSGSLRIGVISSIAHRTPPRDYGPWEHVASTLTEGLVALGHFVTLFATADSLTSATLHALAPRGYEEDSGRREGPRGPAHRGRVRAGRGVRRAVQPVRLPPAHVQPPGGDAGGHDDPRVLVGGDRSGLRAYDDIAHYVAISDADRHPDLGYAATIHHGIDLAPFTFRPDPGSYVLFLARIHPDKGTHRAIEVAHRTGLPLVIAGIVQDRDYFRDRVEPHIGRAGVTYARA